MSNTIKIKQHTFCEKKQYKMKPLHTLRSVQKLYLPTIGKHNFYSRGLMFVNSICMVLLLSGCSRYAQIIFTSTSSPQVKEQNGFFVHENDTIKVSYSFWAEQGIMSFVIQNKLNIPIYIDWKKSSYIDNNMKVDYYSDDVTKTFSSSTVSNVYFPRANWLGIFGPTITSGTVGSEVTTKQERITFVPPNSYIIKSSFKLFANSFFKAKKSDYSEISTDRHQSKLITAYVENADKNTSNLMFRNFITYSTKENFESESYVNNEFYVSKVVTAKEKYVLGGYDYTTKTDTILFEDAKRFYLRNISKSELF